MVGNDILTGYVTLFGKRSGQVLNLTNRQNRYAIDGEEGLEFLPSILGFTSSCSRGTTRESASSTGRSPSRAIYSRTKAYQETEREEEKGWLRILEENSDHLRSTETTTSTVLDDPHYMYATRL